MKYYKEILLMCFSIFLCLFAAELFVRFYLVEKPMPKNQAIVGWANNDYQFLHKKDARFSGWVLQSDRTLQHLDKANGEYNYSIKTGSLNGIGYRLGEKEVELEKCQNQLWNFGDSFAFGFGVAAKDSYVELLSGLGDCSLNFGVPGFTLSQELELFKFQFEHAKIKPKQVTIEIFWGNDIHEQSVLSKVDRSPVDTMDENKKVESINSNEDIRRMHFSRLVHTLEARFFSHSRFYQFLSKKLLLVKLSADSFLQYQVRGTEKFFFPKGMDSTDIYRGSWNSIENFIHLAVDFPFEKYPVQFTYILIPSKEMIMNAKAQPDQRATINAMAEILKTRLQKPNVQVVDLFSVFADNNEFVFFNKDTHLTATGHALVAKQVFGSK